MTVGWSVGGISNLLKFEAGVASYNNLYLDLYIQFCDIIGMIGMILLIKVSNVNHL